MGRVWEARDELLGRDVAIKEISPDGLSAAELGDLRERANREARAIAQVSHPNVVRIFDVVTEGSAPWIVMELVRSRSLLDVVNDEGPMPPERVARIGLDVLGALQAAHRAGILHRDVKPANVLIADDGRVVLTDFGLATLAGDSTMTRTGVVLGSPSYLAPERALDEPARPGSDLWSLGATLFAAVEGRPPYVKSSPMATLAALMVDPPPVSQRAGVLGPALEALLRKDPSERAYADEAERLLRDAANGVMPAGAKKRSRSAGKPDKRSRRGAEQTLNLAESSGLAPLAGEQANGQQSRGEELTVSGDSALASATNRPKPLASRWWAVGAVAVILVVVGVAVARPSVNHRTSAGDTTSAAENPGAEVSAIGNDPAPAATARSARTASQPSASPQSALAGSSVPPTPTLPKRTNAGAPPSTAAMSAPAKTAVPPGAVGRQISSFQTRTCLDARDPSGYLKLWQCRGSDSQRFSFPGDGTMRVLGTCVQIAGVSDGAGLMLTDCADRGSPNWSKQQFNLNKALDLVAVRPDRCVDVRDGNPGNGVRAQIWDCAGTANQKWRY
jgi:serine/threonine protein kinase